MIKKDLLNLYAKHPNTLYGSCNTTMLEKAKFFAAKKESKEESVCCNNY